EHPRRHAVGCLYQRIVTRDVKQRDRRAVIGIVEIKRQGRCDRALAVPRTGRAESARFRKAEACGAIGLEHGRRIHLKNSCWDEGAARSNRVFYKEESRGKDPAAGATISDASVRPYRGGAAAASDGDGRTVGHGRGS